ncbi:MAG: hypothetical protein A2Z34_02190 [Planctomycetes bacterium RBG_16_59_8]|nr:MAG: hypothetical protein A2Z34_02190 [Planctomycetes bacterium RBG_16_59_8]
MAKRRLHLPAVMLLLWLTGGEARSPERPIGGLVSVSGATLRQIVDYRQDFEEAGFPVVDYWDAVRGKSHPHYNKILLQQDNESTHNAHGGSSYLVLRTSGGNTAFQTTRALIKVDPSRSYRLQGWVRTNGLSFNRVFLSLRWLDKLGILLREDKSNTVTRTERWIEMAVNVDHVDPAATYVQLRLNLEGDDLRGEAWFDDFTLASQAKIHAEAIGHPGNIFTTGSEKRFRFSVPAAQAPPTFSFQTKDAAGAELGGVVRDIPTGDERSVVREFDIGKPGYYEILVTAIATIDGKSLSSTKTVPFIVIDPLPPTKEARREFGITFNPFDEETENVPLYAATLGVEKVKVVLWGNGVRPHGGRPELSEIQRLLKEFWSGGFDMTGVIAKPSTFFSGDKAPAAVPGGIISFFSQEQEQWSVPLADLIKRSRDYFSHWQIGTDDDREPMEHIEANRTIPLIEAAIKGVKTFSRVGIPSQAEGAYRHHPSARFIAVNVAGDAAPSVMKSPMVPPEKDVHYVIRPRPLGPGDRYVEMSAQVTDLVKKCVFARAAGIRDLYVPLESDAFCGLLDNDGVPSAAFLALRTMNRLLTGATYQDTHLFSGPTRDFIFRRGNERIIVLWSEEGTVEKELYLGESARIVDATGAVSPMPPDRPLKIGSLPLFIVDVDSQLLETLLSLRFDNDELPLSGKPIQRTLRFTNKFAADMSDVKINLRKVGKDWNVKPLKTGIGSMKTEATFEQKINFRLPYSERGEGEEILVDISFKVDKQYTLKLLRRMTLAPYLDAALTFLEVTPTGGRSLSLVFSNRSDRVVNAKAYVNIPGSRTLEISLAGLLPEKTHSVTMQVPGYPAHRGEKIRVQLFETNGDLFVNREFVIP